MIKMLKVMLVSIGLGVLLTACEKEVFIEPQRFASLTFANYSKDLKEQPIYVTSDGLPAYQRDKSPEGITYMGETMLIPEGKRRLSFFTKKGGTLFLDTVYNAVANKKTQWAYLQPPGAKKPFVIENKYYLEAQPPAGYVKVRAANFTENIFTNPVDVVFYTQGKLGKMIPTDTLKNLPTKLDKYVLIKKGTAYNDFYNTVTFNFVLVDSKTKKPLHNDQIAIRGGYMDGDKDFLSFFINDSRRFILLGTKKRFDVQTLFIN